MTPDHNSYTASFTLWVAKLMTAYTARSRVTAAFCLILFWGSIAFPQSLVDANNSPVFGDSSLVDEGKSLAGKSSSLVNKDNTLVNKNNTLVDEKARLLGDGSDA